MIRRLSFTRGAAELRAVMGLREPLIGREIKRYSPRFNVVPGTRVPVLSRGDYRSTVVAVMAWGFPDQRSPEARAGNRRIVTVPALDLLQRHEWRRPLHARRCLVPADGVSVWNWGASPAWRLVAPDGEPFLIAGIWARFDGLQQDFEAFVLVTTPATGRAAETAAEVPMLIGPAEQDRWMLGAPLEQRGLLERADGGALVPYRIGPRATAAWHDDPACIAPLGYGEAKEATSEPPAA
jgi:putative SOS response-associated peptidase YedK